MFSHVIVGAKDIEASRKFYDATLGALGYTNSFDDPKGRVLWLTPTGNFGITKPIDGQPASVGNGMTIGLAVDSDEKINAWHAAGVANGGTAIEDAPGIRNEGTRMAMYLAYLRDPAGNKLCAMRFIGAAA
jgi:catechol 2,3-dioxygenase-like lactoylglutathione lyase family enzyme